MITAVHSLVIQEPDMRGVWRAKQLAKTALETLGYDKRNWLRIRQIEAFDQFFRTQAPVGDVLEISPGWNDMWKRLPARSYRSVDYPDFDICKDALPEEFDIVIADQVLEHVAQPMAAVRHIYAMVRPGGFAAIASPFLFRVHARPHDYNRWTAAGLEQLLIQGGFSADRIVSDAWGNRACVKAHLKGPVRAYGFKRDMSNDPEYPIMCWAFARKSEHDEQPT
jgi:SAM-dependent methyltransferase